MYERNSKARMHLTYTDSEIEKIRKKGEEGVRERKKCIREVVAGNAIKSVTVYSEARYNRGEWRT